jgi:HSP20 family protein
MNTHAASAAARGKPNKRRKAAMMETEQTPGVRNIDDTIGRVEQLYRAVTGRNVPPGDLPYAPIPAEKDPAEHVEKQLDRLLEALGSSGLATGTLETPPWTPPISVWENDREIRIEIDLPGIPRDEVRVVADGKLLTVSGTRRPTTTDSFRLYSSERPLGQFRRVVYVPTAQREAEPRAEMKDGVLEIRVQKEPSRSASRRTISIN